MAISTIPERRGGRGGHEPLRGAHRRRRQCVYYGEGFGEAIGHCVGHIADDGNVYDTWKGSGEAIGHCVGHAAADGKVYTTPAGASVGLDYCVGRCWAARANRARRRCCCF